MSIKGTIYQSLNNIDICYICEKSGSKLVSPCGNDECDVKIHKKCLIKQIEENKNVCPKCSLPIISNEINKLDLNECCGTLINIFLVIFLYLIAGVGPPLLIFGTLIDGRQLPTGVGSGSYIFSILLSILIGAGCLFAFIAIYISVYFSKDRKFMENQYFNIYLLMMAISIVVIDSIILLCHLIGFFIMKYYYNSGDHFDPSSFITGLIVVVLILASVSLIFGIIYGCYLLYNKNLKVITTYGV